MSNKTLESIRYDLINDPPTMRLVGYTKDEVAEYFNFTNEADKEICELNDMDQSVIVFSGIHTELTPNMEDTVKILTVEDLSFEEVAFTASSVGNQKLVSDTIAEILIKADKYDYLSKYADKHNYENWQAEREIMPIVDLVYNKMSDKERREIILDMLYKAKIDYASTKAVDGQYYTLANIIYKDKGGKEYHFEASEIFC